MIITKFFIIVQIISITVLGLFVAMSLPLLFVQIEKERKKGISITKAEKRGIKSFQYTVAQQIKWHSKEGGEITEKIDLTNVKTIDEAVEMVQENLPNEIKEMPAIQQAIMNCSVTAKQITEYYKGLEPFTAIGMKSKRATLK